MTLPTQPGTPSPEEEPMTSQAQGELPLRAFAKENRVVSLQTKAERGLPVRARAIYVSGLVICAVITVWLSGQAAGKAATQATPAKLAMHTYANTHTHTSTGMPFQAAVQPTTSRKMSPEHDNEVSAKVDARSRSNVSCIDGYLAPTYFLIGAQKAATSSFAKQLLLFARGQIVGKCTSQEVSQGCRRINKEIHWFSRPEKRNRGRIEYLKKYVECPGQSERRVAWDCTPNYLCTKEAPQALAAYYGAMSSIILFQVNLREPASRLQAAFFHMKYAPWWPDFAKYIDYINEGGNHHGLQFSSYAPCIHQWFSVFSSSQFFIVPMGLFTHPPAGVESPINSVMDLLRLRGERLHHKPVHVNAHNHSGLIDTLGAGKLRELRVRLAQNGGSADAVAAVLAFSSARLHGFHGSTGNRTDIASWLEENW
eukprot:TRINITY_DN23903_c0_g1_i1.p1 TRINITY_DN23903_c0_g1~~TRINITY_DN23903_c0_g1_i1.p1  ORF type:complete len:425 (-),score=47.42 TRINITY_DN23903_c0_g1_i1:31-1305(-)